MDKLERISVLSALNEFYDILSSAYDSDGVFGFNAVTMTGTWFAENDKEAEQMLEKLDAVIDQHISENLKEG